MSNIMIDKAKSLAVEHKITFKSALQVLLFEELTQAVTSLGDTVREQQLQKPQEMQDIIDKHKQVQGESPHPTIKLK